MIATIKRTFYGLVAAVIVVVWLIYNHWLGYLFLVVGLLAGLAILLRAAMWAFMPQRRLTADRVRYLHLRLRLRLHPGRGHATIFGLFWSFGRLSMFLRSKRIRPDLTIRERLRNPDEYSTVVGRAHYRYPVRLDLQTQEALISIPRTGKTAALARRVIHHPGSCVITSSQPDLFRMTSGARSLLGRVHLFDPQGLSGAESSFAWDLVAGCADEAVAARRSDALVSSVPTGSSDGSDWFQSKAVVAMKALLVAGGIAGYNFTPLSQWILRGSYAEPVVILEAAGKDQLAATLRELSSSKAERTSASIGMFLSRSVAFCAQPELLVSVLPGPGEGLDLESLVRNRESLYLIASAVGNDNPLNGLFSALVAEIHASALKVAASMPGGRLSPPMYYCLDEFTQVVSGIPVARWAADGGGRGCVLSVVGHGIAQLEERLGKAATRALLDCCSAKLIFGGTSDPETLKMLETLCGEVALREHGHDSHARHPIMSSEMTRQLPDEYALLVVGNSRPVIVRPPMAWRDRTYRRLKRRGQAVAVLAPAALPKVLANGHAPVATVDLLTSTAPFMTEWSSSDD